MYKKELILEAYKENILSESEVIELLSSYEVLTESKHGSAQTRYLKMLKDKMDELKNEINNLEDRYNKCDSSKVKDVIENKIYAKRSDLKNLMDKYHKYNTNSTNITIDGKFASKELHQDLEKNGGKLYSNSREYRPRYFLQQGKEKFKKDFSGPNKFDKRQIEKTTLDNVKLKDDEW